MTAQHSVNSRSRSVGETVFELPRRSEHSRSHRKPRKLCDPWGGLETSFKGSCRYDRHGEPSAAKRRQSQV